MSNKVRVLNKLKLFNQINTKVFMIKKFAFNPT